MPALRRKQADEFARLTRPGSESLGEQTQQIDARRYRILRPIMALVFAEDRQIAKMLPAGETVELVGTAEDQRFVIVATKAERVQVFRADLADRTKATAVAYTRSDKNSAARNGTDRPDARPSPRLAPTKADQS